MTAKHDLFVRLFTLVAKTTMGSAPSPGTVMRLQAVMAEAKIEHFVTSDIAFHGCSATVSIATMVDEKVAATVVDSSSACSISEAFDVHGE